MNMVERYSIQNSGRSVVYLKNGYVLASDCGALAAELAASEKQDTLRQEACMDYQGRGDYSHVQRRYPSEQL